MDNLIASRQLLGINASGEEIEIKLGLGTPYQVNDVAWACPVEALGLQTNLPDIQGIDAFQAIMLAIGLLHSILKDFCSKGGKLLWPEDHSEIPLNELFSYGI